MTQPCIHEQTIGRIKEFIEQTKGIRTALIGIVFAIVIQVVTFGFLWGSLTNTVNKNSDYLWKDITINTRENTRNLDKLIASLEAIKYIAIPGIQGEQGEQGIRGIPGIRGEQGIQGIGSNHE